jgi:integrase
MFNWGVGRELIGSNPLAKLKPLPTDGEKRKDRRSLSVEEVEAVFEASPDWLRPVLRMFAVTGMRRNEVCTLKFSDVDFERGVVIVRAKTAKTKREREIPLDDEMLATIKRLHDDAPFRRPGKGNTAKDSEAIAKRFSKEHVFVTTANTRWGHNLLKRFYVVCKRAGIRGAQAGGSVDLHALRVTFTTLSIQNGGNPTDVQATLGHASLKMTMDIYSKSTDHGKRAAVSALPFAKVSNPGHVIPLLTVAKIGGVAKSGTSAPDASQIVAG